MRVLRAGLPLVRGGGEGLGSAARKRVVFLIFYCHCYFLKGGERVGVHLARRGLWKMGAGGCRRGGRHHRGEQEEEEEEK